MPFVIRMASPEKALIDLLHLYPEYKTVKDMVDLRLDEDYMKSGMEQGKLLDYVTRIHSPTLSKRVDLLREVYGSL